MTGAAVRESSALADAAASTLDLGVGALVVYGGHGVGRVSRSRNGGPSQGRHGSVVVEFPAGLSVTLPIERAVACLRPLSGEAELACVQDALRSRDGSIEKSWQARARSTRAKIAAGEAVGLAEVVRDAARRERPSSSGSKLSSYERELYLKARRLLAAELGASTGTDEARAEAWIDDQLEWAAVGRDEHLSR